MANPISSVCIVAGRLAIDFANLPSLPASGESNGLSWEELVEFLHVTRIVSLDRAEELGKLTDSDPQAAYDLLGRAERLRDALRLVLRTLSLRDRVRGEWIAPINEVLRVTEGHDELLQTTSSTWRMEYIAREGGLDWLLAAIARSAAELIVEGQASQVRLCANPACSLFFYDNSRTRRRRWCSMAHCGNRHKVAAFARRRSLKRRAAGA